MDRALARGAAAGSKTYTLSVGGTTVAATNDTSNGPISMPWDTRQGSDGSTTLTASARDSAGNTGSSARVVNVANGQPAFVAGFTCPAEGATVTGTVQVCMSATGGTGTITYTLSIDGTQVFATSTTATSATFNWNTSTYSNGAHTLSLSVRDGAGRTASATRTVTVGTRPPLAASITAPSEGATVSGPVTVGMSESGGSGAITWTLRLDGGATAIYTTSGTATTASFSWDTSAVAPGPHQLQLTVQDGGGSTATATRNVTVQPQQTGTIRVFITQPATDGTTVSGTVWFTIWLENAAAGTRNLTLSIDGVSVATTATTSNGPISMPWNSAGASGGTHTATVSVRDAAGNTGSADRTIVIAGGPAPLVASFTTPTSGATVSGMVTVSMSASGASGTPIAFTLTVDGAQVFTTSGASASASFTWNSNSVGNGPHTLGLTVQDGAGRSATATRQVTVTTAAMLTQFTSPSEGASVGGTITVTASLTGGTAPYTWTVTVDNATQIFTTSGSATSVSFNWNTTTVPDGSHTLKVSVQDSIGSSASVMRGVTVQQVQPSTISVFITQPASDGTSVSGTTWFTIWIEKAAAGSKTYTMTVGGNVVATTSTTSNGPVSMPWATNGTPNGSTPVTISVRDAAGGAGSAVRVVNVSN